ncbi:hypothetical protein FSP39_001515 [Pinctada imbricata]|uniref:Uncharacterized protein n=1 Tax=Pinctada imbricata TaxID=66713 RepID=A0AA89BLD0_PINIB|nr:hypothetical protein FSP39_001515 [Pinctada imbricata]
MDYAESRHREKKIRPISPRYKSTGYLQHPKRYTLKVVLLGDYGVGKTTLARRFHSAVHENNEMDTTLNKNLFYDGSVDINDDIVTLRLVDTAGQERYRSITSSYYRGANCCLLVFNTGNKTSFNNIGSWFDEANGRISNTDNVTFILVGVTKDFSKREVTSEQCEKIADYLDLPYIEVDTRNESNVLELFKILASTTVVRLKRTMSISVGVSLNTSPMSNSDSKATKLFEKAKWKFSICSC